MYLLILFLPLLSAFISGFFGRYIGEKGAGYYTIISIVITAILSWTALYNVAFMSSPVYIHLWNWITSGNFTINFGLQFDTITVVMLTLITSISALVHLYSTEYMAGDPHIPRFMSYLSLFTFFMIVLVTADNFLQLFIGWEGVGLCSYLLINFWYTRIKANKSAMKAMIVNRVGDIGITLGMFTIFYVFKSVDFGVVFSLVPQMKDFYFTFLTMDIHALTLISLLLFIGAVGKSAQLGLHTWLPDAMEGPTPVSALIHAATMVTAGVFLLIRSSPILEFAPSALFVIVVVGAITAIFAASIGLVQHDIKKVIAYSTCSQLGYMIFACGLSNYSTSLFHLFNHGMFKALLFLSAGSVIHAMADEQDMRKFGALIRSLPFTYSMMLIGSLSLMGFPFLTGFYSKDPILEFAFATFSIDGTFAHWLGTLAALFTAFYSFRLIYLTFISPSNSSLSIYLKSHESPWRMSLPLFILAFASIFIGYIFKDAFIGLGSNFFGNSIFIMPSNADIYIEAEFVSPIFKWIPVIFSVFGAILAVVLYHLLNDEVINMKKSLRNTYIFLINKWNFDQIYNAYIAKPLLRFGHEVSYKTLDRGYIEMFGPTGIKQSVSYFTNISSLIQSGLIYHYAFVIIVFISLQLWFLNISPLFIVLVLFLLLNNNNKLPV